MKKKLKKVAKKKPTVSPLAGRLPQNQGEWLVLAIKHTKKVIHDPPVKEEDFLRNQIDRLTKQLHEWMKNESKN